MKQARRLLYYAAAALAIALLIFLLLHYTGQNDETAQVILPPPAEQSDGDERDDEHSSALNVADVNPETVLTILRELSRADSYSRELTVETLWADGSAAETISVWAKGGTLRVTSGERNLLLSEGRQWLWYSDDNALLESGQDARVQADRYQRMLTYEELLSGDHRIEDASYTVRNEEPCIFVAYRSGAFDYLNHLYVSVANGLLIAAETYDGETCVYRMSSGPVDLSTPEDALLSPPPVQ